MKDKISGKLLKNVFHKGNEGQKQREDAVKSPS
jgi:hypothetical protein